MPRALLAIFLSLFATAAFANRTICTEDPMSPIAKPSAKLSARAAVPVVAAAPVVATAPANHARVPAAPANTNTATASANPATAAHPPSRPRVISARWQSLLPGMIR